MICMILMLLIFQMRISHSHVWSLEPLERRINSASIWAVWVDHPKQESASTSIPGLFLVGSIEIQIGGWHEIKLLITYKDMISIHQFMCRKHVTVFDILPPPIHRFIFMFLLNLRFYSFPKSQIYMFWHNPPIRLPSFAATLASERGCKVLPRLSPWPSWHRSYRAAGSCEATQALQCFAGQWTVQLQPNSLEGFPQDSRSASTKINFGSNIPIYPIYIYTYITGWKINLEWI